MSSILAAISDSPPLYKAFSPLDSKSTRWTLPLQDPPMLFGLAGNSPTPWRNTDEVIPKYPVGYLRPNQTLVPYMGSVIIPCEVTSFRFACELGVILSRDAKCVPIGRAMDHVFGYITIMDMVSNHWKDVAREGNPHQNPTFDELMVTSYYGRGTDGFLPVGKTVVTKDQVSNPYDLIMYTKINGEILDRTHTGAMIVGIESAISQLSNLLTLPAGSVIHMGTMGIDGITIAEDCKLDASDVLEVEIEHVGVAAVTTIDHRGT